MKRNARDNLAKFLYDAAKLSLAMLVFGVMTRSPVLAGELAWGIFLTLLLVSFGVTIDFVPAKKEE